MGGVYALVSGKINSLFLPGIPLSPPAEGLSLYLLGFVLFGAFLGWISSLPENKIAGMALGGLVTAVMLTARSLARTWGQDSFGGIFLYLSCAFLPLIVLMMPVSLLLRAGIDAQQPDPDRPTVWARKYLIPLALTLAAIGLGSLSLYSKVQRQAIVRVQEMITEAKPAAGFRSLPEPLQDVTGYVENARGDYSLSYSDQVDMFMGPRPAGDELSQFLVVALYDNGYAFACIFSTNRFEPNCAEY